MSRVVEVAVPCSGSDHRLVWDGAQLVAADHPQAERERALTALGADPLRCLQLLDVWNRHEDDLGVLVLAARGSGDLLPAGPTDRRVRSLVTSHVTGWTMHPPAWSGSGGRSSSGRRDDRVPRSLDLEDLMRTPGLGAALTDQVLRTWVARVAARDPRAVTESARLHAAVYGRLTAAVRAWLDDARLRVSLRVAEPDAARELVAGRPGEVRVRVPFAWLAEVWQPGLALVAGRFCLAATGSDSDGWRLDAIEPDLTTRRTVSLSVR